MATTILYAGGEGESVTLTGGTTFSTNTANFDATDVRSAINTGLSTSSAAIAFSPAPEAWFHTRFSRTTSVIFSDIAPFTFSGGGVDFLRVFVKNSDNEAYFQYFNGTVWVDIGTPFISTFGGNVKRSLDVDIKLSATAGHFTIYTDGVVRASFSGNTTLAVTSFDAVTLSSANNTAFGYTWGLLVQTGPTIGAVVQTMGPDGFGTNTAWTGSYLDVDEVGTVVATDFVSSGTAGQESSFSLSAPPTSPANTTISGVVVSAEASIGLTGPQNLQLTTVLTAVTYPSANLSGLSVSLTQHQDVLAVNPATGLAWDTAALTTLEAGLKSIA